MSSSEEEEEDEEDKLIESPSPEPSGVNLTSFLFGNVDEKGELQDDMFDEDSRKNLASLARLGLGNFMHALVSTSKEGGASPESPSSLQVVEDEGKPTNI